jgi:hypothetical protein
MPDNTINKIVNLSPTVTVLFSKVQSMIHRPLLLFNLALSRSNHLHTMTPWSQPPLLVATTPIFKQSLYRLGGYIRAY